MPTFLKGLRRSSTKSSKKDNVSVYKEKTDNTSDGTSSSLSSTNNGSTSPPASVPSDRSASDVKTVNSGSFKESAAAPGNRPTLNSQRYSISSMMSNGNGAPKSPTSPLAPRIISVSENSWVHQKILLVYGQIGDPNSKPLDGTVTIYHHLDSFPATNWPVCDSHFKALVHLQTGPNKLRFDFVPVRGSGSTSPTLHTSWLTVNYLPLNNAPPIQLVILLAKDSPGTFDAVPQRAQAEGHSLDTAIRKFRMAAYLWQAFTGEQMSRAGFGRRCFRYEEEWTDGTTSISDRQTGKMRNEAKIHVIRMDKTLKDIRDLDVAQQYSGAKRSGDLYSWATDAVKDYFKPKAGQKLYVSCLYLDSHWDTKAKVVRGHAALGGANDPVHLAIFGSHALQSYPTAIEEVVPAFSDCTKTDTRFVANDANESGSSWEAANIGIGAHLHETGHLLGCPHQENGVMLRDYVRLNRTFLTREPYSTRTKQPGQRLVLRGDECGWHRLDCLRFRYHPCFRLPTDPPVIADESVQVWTVENGTVLATAPTGIAFIEIYGEGDDVCRAWNEYIDGVGNGGGNGPPKQLMLIESELRSKLPADKQKKTMKIEIHSAGQGKRTIDDFASLTGKNAMVKLPNGRMGYRGAKLGFSQMDGTKHQELVLDSATKQSKLLLSIRVFAGYAVDGIEFIYEDRSTQLFGNRGGSPTDFALDTRKGETLLGFYLRAGLWIDGLQVWTSTGRKSQIFGNATGGSGHTLIPPRGYNIVGIYGSCGQWLDGFGLIISR
ncbi:hypothetical protein NA57DRAFT_75524 [Rhizodiscina lignyota]|uniref:Jacalin-type lectin domain-containing protein n=1 Tax=Rhizodiscina lignyota TaxID=1504668 RepID=A0A9P4IKW0_9PEZI|nr:hypothetical protein NA57DRAFT_75524 [Rhizodiscina lignyota]